jgi:hypothetical protein
MEFASDPTQGMTDPEPGLLEVTEWHESGGQVAITGNLRSMENRDAPPTAVTFTTYVPQNFALQPGQRLFVARDRAQPDRVVVAWEQSDPTSPVGRQLQQHAQLMTQVQERVKALGDKPGFFRKAKAALSTPGLGGAIIDSVRSASRRIPGGDPDVLRGHAVTATVLTAADEETTDTLVRIPTTRLDVEVRVPGREPFPGVVRIKFADRVAKSRAVAGAEVPVLLDPATPHVIVLDVDQLAAASATPP